MWRFALSRRWWSGHLLVMLCGGLFVGLGSWQWDRAQSPTGGWLNLGYALQWPLFAVVLVAAWARFLWLEQHRIAEPACPTRNPTPPAIRRPIPEDDLDDELAAYNAYLVRLAEQDRQS